ncbi:hypothetical protein B9Z19DRAFT_1093216 [Tuber borchii]|uniref:Uncharacterized protein n=1 Tax=Tuber borchii TaxID=42251 RepID=A0A2T6ZFN3_TUBBO|nr:hypothetical protein B9Z19DRAFT_1093216 [Tuber borchii]
MQKRVDHLIAIKAFTRQSTPIPSGTSFESAVKALLEKWEDERTGYLSVTSPILFNTLSERSRQPRGVLPLITEKPAAVKSFAYYPSSLGILRIRDTRGVILGYRFKIPPHLLTTLNNSSQTLDSCGASNGGGGGRSDSAGLYESRDYTVSAADGKKYAESRELLRDGEKGREWLRENQELFDYCSNQLRFLSPEQYVRMTGSVVKDMAKTQSADGRRLRPLGGAWHGVSLNQETDSESGSRCHQDWSNDKRLFNCIVPFGEGFQGGELVLWQMKMRIGLEIGYGFFFYGSLVAHEMMDVTAGVRNSIDLFTHASNYELLAKHEQAAGKVKYPAKQKKPRSTKKKEEGQTVKENVATRRKIREGKKLRQSATSAMRIKREM